MSPFGCIICQMVTHRLADALGAQLRAEKAVSQVTIEELATAAGVSPATVHRYLNGEREAPASVLFEFTTVLDIDLPTLIERAITRIQPVPTRTH